MNKYYTWYHRIVNHRKANILPKDVYTERHHIVPRSLNGGDDLSNLVDLTAKEHFLCHYLLTKMYQVGSTEWYKMQHAFLCMAASSNGKRYFNSRLYDSCRQNFSKVMSLSQSGDKNSQFGKIWITNISLGKNQKITEDDLLHWLSIGWTKGRIINFEKARKPRINKKDLANSEIKKYARTMFEKYLNSDCSSIREFVSKGYYPNSHVSLTILWKKHIPEYTLLIKPRMKR